MWRLDDLMRKVNPKTYKVLVHGFAVRELRHQLNLSREALAEQWGVSARWIEEVETKPMQGRRLDEVYRFCEVVSRLAQITMTDVENRIRWDRVAAAHTLPGLGGLLEYVESVTWQTNVPQATWKAFVKAQRWSPPPDMRVQVGQGGGVTVVWRLRGDVMTNIERVSKAIDGLLTSAAALISDTGVTPRIRVQSQVARAIQLDHVLTAGLWTHMAHHVSEDRLRVVCLLQARGESEWALTLETKAGWQDADWWDAMLGAMARHLWTLGGILREPEATYGEGPRGPLYNAQVAGLLAKIGLTPKEFDVHMRSFLGTWET